MSSCHSPAYRGRFALGWAGGEVKQWRVKHGGTRPGPGLVRTARVWPEPDHGLVNERSLASVEAPLDAAGDGTGSVGDTRGCAFSAEHHDLRLAFHGFLNVLRHNLFALC